MSMLAFILKFIQHPISAFAVGILIMYGVLLYLDWSSRKEQVREERERTPEGQNELAVEFRATLAACRLSPSSRRSRAFRPLRRRRSPTGS